MLINYIYIALSSPRSPKNAVGSAGSRRYSGIGGGFGCPRYFCGFCWLLGPFVRQKKVAVTCSDLTVVSKGIGITFIIDHNP